MLTKIQAIYALGIILSVIVLGVVNWFFYRKNQELEKTSSTTSELIYYISQGCKLYVSKQFKVISVVFIFLFSLLGLFSYLLSMEKLPMVIFILIGGVMSGFLGLASVKLTLKAIYHFIDLENPTMSTLYRRYITSGVFISSCIFGIVLFEILSLFLVVHILLYTNAFNVGQIFFNNIFDLNWSRDLFQNLEVMNEVTLFFSQTLMAYVAGFSLRLFLYRLQGGIFASSSDIAADFVGQTEFDLPEDDLRNPASIADHVGDQIKNSLSFSMHVNCGILFLMSVVSLFGAFSGIARPDLESEMLVVAPFLLVCIGFCALIVTHFMSISFRENDLLMENIQRIKAVRTVIAFLMIVGLSFGLVITNLIPKEAWIAFVIGVLCCILMERVVSCMCGIAHSFVKKLAVKSEFGVMTNIVYGLSIGFIGTVVLLFLTVFGLSYVFFLTGTVLDVIHDFYNVGCFCLGLMVGVMQFLPEAIGLASIDNAIGCTEMLNQTSESKKKLWILEGIGSTAKSAINAIVSVTTLISGLLFVFFYVQSLKKLLVGISKIDSFSLDKWTVVYNGSSDISHHIISTTDLTIRAMFDLFDIHLLNPKLMIGIIFGTGVIMLAIALILHAIERNLSGLTSIIRSEFSENSGIWSGERLPNYEKVLSFSIEKAQRWMCIIALSMVVTPLIMSVTLGVTGVIGYLVGCFVLASTFSLIFTISGVAWKNAKRVIELEDDMFIGKNKHISACVGNIIGDSFKDGIAPTLISMVQVLAFISLLIIVIALKNSAFIHL